MNQHYITLHYTGLKMMVLVNSAHSSLTSVFWLIDWLIYFQTSLLGEILLHYTTIAFLQLATINPTEIRMESVCWIAKCKWKVEIHSSSLYIVRLKADFVPFDPAYSYSAHLSVFRFGPRVTIPLYGLRFLFPHTLSPELFLFTHFLQFLHLF